MYIHIIYCLLLCESVFLLLRLEKKNAHYYYTHIFSNVYRYIDRFFCIIIIYRRSRSTMIILSRVRRLILYVLLLKTTCCRVSFVRTNGGGRAISPIRNSTQQRTDDETLITVKIDHTSYNVSKITMKKYSKLD